MNWIYKDLIKWTHKDLIKWIKKGCNKEESKNVFKLDISYNKLKTIPKEIFYLTSLRIFSCDYNQITEIPKKSKNLKVFRFLSLVYEKNEIFFIN